MPKSARVAISTYSFLSWALLVLVVLLIRSLAEYARLLVTAKHFHPSLRFVENSNVKIKCVHGTWNLGIDPINKSRSNFHHPFSKLDCFRIEEKLFEVV
jgi:hypothetical protein